MSEPGPQRMHREPTLTLPEMRVRDAVSPQDLPIVSMADDESLVGLRIDGRRVEEDVALEEVAPAETVAPVLRAAPVEPEAVPVSARHKHSAPAEPVVEWPADVERRIVALRIVSASPERFSGRVVRTALAAEGFQLGKYAIFHKPDAQGRALFSAASLSKPGNFDLDTMDTQRFGGLSLFAVLPGPKPVRDTFEDLLAAARNLNERLHGGLQDERGSPLTPGRIVEIREELGPLGQVHAAAHQESEETP